VNTLALLVILLQASQLVPWTKNTYSVPGLPDTYTNGVYQWEGNPFCAEAGFLVQPASQASVEKIGACYNVQRVAPAAPSDLKLSVQNERFRAPARS